jgi:hypothetical protein
MSQGVVSPAQSVAIEYNLLDNGIHVFRFLSDKRQSVDEFLNALDSVIATAPQDEVFRYIIDNRKIGMPPLQHYYQASLNWVRLRPSLPPLRTVYLTDFSPMTTLADTFVSLIQRTTNIEWEWRFMTHETIMDASQWLSN